VDDVGDTAWEPLAATVPIPLIEISVALEVCHVSVAE
jgi:hypothetical protein